MQRLPVSGIEATLRAPDGTDDILLQEASGGPVEVGIGKKEKETKKINNPKKLHHKKRANKQKQR